jgi:hypothetical protein
MEVSFSEKLSELFQILSFTCGLPEQVSDTFEIKGPNSIICKTCNHETSFLEEDYEHVSGVIDAEDPEDLKDMAIKHAREEHGKSILREYLKDADTLLDSEKSIVSEFLSEKLTLEEFADKMIENSKLVA